MEYFKAKPIHHKTLNWGCFRSFEVSLGWDWYWLCIWPLWKTAGLIKIQLYAGSRHSSALHTLNFWSSEESPSLSSKSTELAKPSHVKDGVYSLSMDPPSSRRKRSTQNSRVQSSFLALAKISTQLRALQILRQLHTNYKPQGHKLNSAFHSLYWSRQEANYSLGFSSNAWLNVRDL